MVDFQKLLDAVTAALGQPVQEAHDVHSRPGKGMEDGPRPPGQLMRRARDLAVQHPALTQAALLGLAGLMLGRKRKGLAGNLVRLGGLAVIGGLAYRVFQGGSAELPDTVKRTWEGAGTMPAKDADGSREAGAAEEPGFHSVTYTEDDAMLFLRAMVAAAASDGRIDETERARIVKGLTEAGIDPVASRWLDDEMASPADVDEIAESVNDPERAAQVYAAARIAVDPDTMQERDFLHRLAEALDLDPLVRAQIDDTADSLR